MAKSDLQGKVIVITGASSGFGKGAALKFAEQGANLVLAARRAELLEAAKQMHKTQYEKAPPAADSPGAVHSPMSAGTGVSAGRR